MLYLVIIINVIFWIYAKLTLEILTQPPAYTESASGVILSAAAIFTFIGLARHAEGELFQQFRFWACIAIIINYAGNLPFYALNARLIYLPATLVESIWPIHWLLTILVSLCLASSFLCLKRL